jgi:vacuolar protein sorting-associated protein 53
VKKNNYISKKKFKMEDEELLDEEFLNDNLLSKEVQEAIASILPSEDPLDKPDFDLIEYINELFPNEQSLSNIDEVINKDRSRIKYIIFSYLVFKIS